MIARLKRNEKRRNSRSMLIYTAAWSGHDWIYFATVAKRKRGRR